MRKQITKKQLELQELVHRTGGNGWAMVEDIDPEFCRVIAACRGLGTQCFLAAKSMLEPERREVIKGEGEVDIMIEPKVLEQLEVYRNRIRSGTHKVKDTRIVEA